MVCWSDPSDISVTFVPAQRCSKNKGIIRKDVTKEPSQHTIYVDDNFMVDIQRRLACALVAAIEAIFIVMGVSNLLLRPCGVAMDKWVNLNVNAVQILLGMLWNTCDVTVGITSQFRLETVHLLHSVWHNGRESFTV